ncbi:MAG TPA: response regulator [Candidatus Methanoperedens sp.]|nr:response regulator [Candidatus Methanoperedens sp.]
MEKRVLVVDDDQVVGKSFERVLSEKGYKVDTALNGREAFEKYAGADFDMVFMDLKMPGPDGLEVAQRIKEMNPWLPIVVVTGYGTQEAEERAKVIGVADFLHKPLTPAAIEEVAARVTEHKAAPAAEAAAAPAKRESVARNVALFFAAPFIGLAYILAFPFIAVWMMGRYGWRAIVGRQ